MFMALAQGTTGKAILEISKGIKKGRGLTQHIKQGRKGKNTFMDQVYHRFEAISLFLFT